jgi:hypothetical protein
VRQEPGGRTEMFEHFMDGRKVARSHVLIVLELNATGAPITANTQKRCRLFSC